MKMFKYGLFMAVAMVSSVASVEAMTSESSVLVSVESRVREMFSSADFSGIDFDGVEEIYKSFIDQAVQSYRGASLFKVAFSTILAVLDECIVAAELKSDNPDYDGLAACVANIQNYFEESIIWFRKADGSYGPLFNRGVVSTSAYPELRSLVTDKCTVLLEKIKAARTAVVEGAMPTPGLTFAQAAANAEQLEKLRAAQEAALAQAKAALLEAQRQEALRKAAAEKAARELVQAEEARKVALAQEEARRVDLEKQKEAARIAELEVEDIRSRAVHQAQVLKNALEKEVAEEAARRAAENLRIAEETLGLDALATPPLEVSHAIAAADKGGVNAVENIELVDPAILLNPGFSWRKCLAYAAGFVVTGTAALVASGAYYAPGK
jgi:hypothetical protein